MHKRILLFWLTACGVLTAFALVGCGGGGSSAHTAAPGTGVSGKTSTPTVTATAPTAAAPAPGQTQPITLTVNGVQTTVDVPGGQTIAAGSQVLLIPSTLPIDVGGVGGATGAMGRRPQTTAPGGGEIYFQQADGTDVDSGLEAINGQIVASGTTYPYYALPYPPAGQTSNIDMVIKGPVDLGVGSSVLSVSGEVDFFFQISNGGALGAGEQSTYPTAALYALPANGQSTYESFIQLTLGQLSTTTPVPATIMISWPGETKTQTRNTFGGVTTLWAADDNALDLIPGTGITSASLSVQAPLTAGP